MYGIGPPWSSQISLKEMIEDVGINFDKFIDFLADGKTDEEIASETLFPQSLSVSFSILNSTGSILLWGRINKNRR